MNWKMSRISSSLMGLMREPEAETGPQTQVDLVRAEMLDCMATFLHDVSTRPSVWVKVHCAEDMQTLWYLRSDVMHLLSTYCGEALAARKVARLTELFRGYLPAAQFASARRRS